MKLNFIISILLLFSALLMCNGQEEGEYGQLIQIETINGLDKLLEKSEYVLVLYMIEYCTSTSRIIQHLNDLASYYKKTEGENNLAKLQYAYVDSYFNPEVSTHMGVFGAPKIYLYSKKGAIEFQWDPNLDDFKYFTGLHVYDRIPHFASYEEWKNATNHLSYRAVFIGNPQWFRDQYISFKSLALQYPLYNFMSIQSNEKIYRLLKMRLSEERFVDVHTKNMSILSNAVKEYEKKKKGRIEQGLDWTDLKIEELEVPEEKKTPTMNILPYLHLIVPTLNHTYWKNQIHVALLKPNETFVKEEISASLATNVYFRNLTVDHLYKATFEKQLKEFFEANHKPFSLQSFTQRAKDHIISHNLTVFALLYRDKLSSDEKFYNYFYEAQIDLLNRTYYNFLFSYSFDYKISEFDKMIFYISDIYVTEMDRRLAYYLGVQESNLPKLMAFRFNIQTLSLDKWAFSMKTSYYSAIELMRFYREVMNDPNAKSKIKKVNQNPAKPQSESRIVAFSPQNIEKIVSTKKSLSKTYECILVEFCADYCIHCQKLKFILDKISMDKEHQKKMTKPVLMTRIDLDKNEIGLHVESVPTIRMYCDQNVNIFTDIDYEDLTEEKIKKSLEDFYLTRFAKQRNSSKI